MSFQDQNLPNHTIYVQDADFIKTLASKYKCSYLNGKRADQEREIIITPIYGCYSRLSGVMITVNGSPPKAEFFIPLMFSSQLGGDFNEVISVGTHRSKTFRLSSTGLYALIKGFIKKHRLAWRIPEYCTTEDCNEKANGVAQNV